MLFCELNNLRKYEMKGISINGFGLSSCSLTSSTVFNGKKVSQREFSLNININYRDGLRLFSNPFSWIRNIWKGAAIFRYGMAFKQGHRFQINRGLNIDQYLIQDSFYRL